LVASPFLWCNAFRMQSVCRNCITTTQKWQCKPDATPGAQCGSHRAVTGKEIVLSESTLLTTVGTPARLLGDRFVVDLAVREPGSGSRSLLVGLPRRVARAAFPFHPPPVRS
jgi:hypothetical protein